MLCPAAVGIPASSLGFEAQLAHCSEAFGSQVMPANQESPAPPTEGLEGGVGQAGLSWKGSLMALEMPAAGSPLL